MSITIGLIITEQFIKDNTQIDENVDIVHIRNTIREAQDIYIHPLLGSGLYNEIIAGIVAGSTSSNNQTLIDSGYLAWALTYWTLYEGVDTFTYKFRNKGIQKMSSENSQPISSEETKRLMDGFRNKAEWYSERVTRYLCENETTYPLYTNPGNGSDIIYPKKNNFTTGWFLGSDKKQNQIDIIENGKDE